MRGEKRGTRRKRRNPQIMQRGGQRTQTIIIIDMGMIEMGMVVMMRVSEINILRI